MRTRRWLDREAIGWRRLVDKLRPHDLRRLIDEEDAEPWTE